MGGYSRHQSALEALRSVRGRLDSKGSRRRARPEPPVIAHKLSQRLQLETITQLLADYQAGSSTPALARQYRISATSVKTLLHARGVAVRRPRKLTEPEVLTAAELYQAGWSLAKLGQKFDVDDTTVWRRLKQVGVDMRAPYERSRR